MITIIEPDSDVTILNQIIATTIGRPGPQGPAGAPGGTSSISMIASGAIGGHRLVIPDGTGKVVYGDSETASHCGKIMGMTMGAAADGAAIEVLTLGEVVEPSWNWTVGPVYAGVNGVPTQTPPTVGFLQVIGVAIAPTKLSFDLQQAILLN